MEINNQLLFKWILKFYSYTSNYGKKRIFINNLFNYLLIFFVKLRWNAKLLYVTGYDFPEPIRTIMMITQIITGIWLFIIVIATYSYYKKYPAYSEISTNYIIGILIVFIILTFYRFLFFYHDFFAPDDLDTILSKIANSSLLVGLIILNYILERYIYKKKTKYIFTIVGIIFLILYNVVVDPSLVRIIIQFGSFLLIIFPLIVHIIIAIRGTGWIRQKAILICVGIIILIFSTLGLFLFESFGLIDHTLSLILGFPLSLIGYAFTGYGLMTILYET